MIAWVRTYVSAVTKMKCIIPNLVSLLSVSQRRNKSTFMCACSEDAKLNSRYYIFQGFLCLSVPCTKFLFPSVHFPQIRFISSLVPLHYHSRLDSACPFSDAMLDSVPVPNVVISNLPFHKHRQKTLYCFVYCVVRRNGPWNGR